jgi:hypothetical protein
VTSLQEIAAIEAELNHYRDSAALLRARLYRQGAVSSPRLTELQRRRDSAQRRLRAARTESPRARADH